MLDVMGFQESGGEVSSNFANATCSFNPFPTPSLFIVRLAKLCGAILLIYVRVRPLTGKKFSWQAEFPSDGQTE